jgi:hypothetical protein
VNLHRTFQNFSLGVLFGLWAPGLLGAAPLLAQGDAALETRTREYLERLGALWTRELPSDVALGIYFGRRWIGQASASVKRVPAGDPGVFEVTWNVESKLSGKWICTRDRVLLARNLALVYAQSFEEGPNGKITCTLTAQDARWKLRREQKGIATYQEGALRPGMTWNASFFPVFRRPEELPVALLALDGDQSPVVFDRLSPPGESASESPGGAEATLVVRRGNTSPGVWRFTKEGQIEEFRPAGEFIRFRPVKPEQVAKDLEDFTPLSDAVRALVDVFRSVKRGDRTALASALDFESLAQELVSGYSGLDPTIKRQVVDALRAKTPTELTAAKFRESLPDESLMEEYFAAESSAVEQNGKVEVRLLGRSAVWKLVRATEGRMKGRWLVCGIK